MEKSLTRELATFVSRTRYDALPSDVVHETKRIFLDVVGCALGGGDLDKGKIAIQFARQTGGRPEASILGTSDKTTAATAAFANGELMHALDHCPLLPPGHVTPFVTAAPLALAEIRGSSGKDLITAVALAHEVASRVGLSLDSMRAKEGGLVASSWGLGFDQFGATAGAAKILGLDIERMSDAMGLAGYFAPVPSHNKFLNSKLGGGLAKYGPAGWMAQGGVTSAVLASMGYEGDRSVLDGEYGFWAMAGSRNCNAEVITREIGNEWNILRVMYKRWPCAGLLQSPLGAFERLIKKHTLNPEEIQRVVIKNEAQGTLPRFHNDKIRHHVDTQTDLKYLIAMTAHRVPISPDWQKPVNFNSPAIHSFITKVTIEPYATAEETRYQELIVEGRKYIERRPSLLQVTARGQEFEEHGEYAQWLSIENPDFRASDEDLVNKFRVNAQQALPVDKIDRAIDKIMNLDQIKNVGDLVNELVL